MQVSKFSSTSSSINEDCIAFKEQYNVARFAVADGIGGFECSQLAARIAVNAIVRCQQQQDASDIDVSFKVALRKLNRLAKRYNKSSRIGTTLTAGIIRDQTLYVCHTGDSRLYLIRGDRILFRTRDQSIAREISDGNKNTVLLHALVSGQPLQLLKNEIPVKRHDMLLLMTDGVYSLINDHQLLFLCNCCKSTEDLCLTVKAYVELKGAKDDYSFMAARV